KYDESLAKEGVGEKDSTTLSDERKGHIVASLTQNYGRGLSGGVVGFVVFVFSILVNTQNLARAYAIALRPVSFGIMETPIGRRLLERRAQAVSQQNNEALLSVYEGYLSVRLLHMGGRGFFWLLAAFLFYTNMAGPAIQSLREKDEAKSPQDREAT